MRLLKGLCLGAGCLLVGACAEDVDSSNVKTDGMFANFEVTGRANGQSEVRASILIGGSGSNTYANLTAGDVLSATSGDETHELTELGGTLGDVHIYHATFDGADEGQEFTVSFDREEDESAPNSTSALPAPFSITAPAEDAEVSRAAALTVSWTPSTSEAVNIHLDGDCIILHTFTASSDTGTHTFEAGTLDTTASHEGDTCDVELTVSTRAAGTVDSAFGEGGRFTAIQERKIAFRSTP